MDEPSRAEEINPVTGERFRRPDDIFQLRVTLLEVEPPIWRRLLVAQDLALPRLHSILQVVMGWTDSHLHQFRAGEVGFGEPTMEYEPGPIDHRRITVNQILPRRGASCVYEYDFGDGWEHLLEVEAELPVESVKDPIPRCLGGERACPPEDCGGPGGYMRLLEAVQDANDEEHDDYLEWLGQDFDSEAFDLRGVNSVLARFRTRSRQRNR
ncbi:MAG: plasmid pRiA4b ORF-3 family protein [Candidatus Dormibacteraeota bacterium]|nr:plasmid pRiA4b ORF-3 family protein [Candidatus Dormibacteraeota bacterium]